MSMTKLRKSLQDKLRRKFGWQTNTNYNRGTILIKPNACTHLYHEPKYVIDLAINIDDWRLRRNLVQGDKCGIEVVQTKSEFTSDRQYVNKEELVSYISVEELDLVHRIVHEKIAEIMDKKEKKND